MLMTSVWAQEDRRVPDIRSGVQFRLDTNPIGGKSGRCAERGFSKGPSTVSLLGGKYPDFVCCGVPVRGVPLHCQNPSSRYDVVHGDAISAWLNASENVPDRLSPPAVSSD